MQDRYVGDVGDYVKLAFLRALQPGRKLGVAWWLFPDEHGNGDGRHIEYLRRPEKWRALDPTVFDALAQLVAAGTRTVAGLQQAIILPGAVYFENLMPIDAPPARLRAQRNAWFAALQAELKDCDLLFVDPDNGLEPAGYSLSARSGGKSVSLAQLLALSRLDRTMVVYHHQTRRPGGHEQELAYWALRLHDVGFVRVDVLRARPFSPRAYFLLNANETLRTRARDFAARSPEWLSFRSNESFLEKRPTDGYGLHREA